MTHYFARPRAAIIRIETAELRRGDTVHVRGHTTDFYQQVERLERNHASVERASAGEEIAVQLSQRVREGDRVYRLSSPAGS